MTIIVLKTVLLILVKFLPIFFIVQGNVPLLHYPNSFHLRHTLIRQGFGDKLAILD